MSRANRSPVTMPQPFTAAQRAKARQLREQGMSLTRISRELKCGFNRLAREMPELHASAPPARQSGAPLQFPPAPNRPLTDAEKREIERLHAAGKTGAHIAKAIRRERNRVHGYLALLRERAAATEPPPNVALPRRFVNAAMTEPLREKPWTPPRG